MHLYLCVCARVWVSGVRVYIYVWARERVRACVRASDVTCVSGILRILISVTVCVCAYRRSVLWTRNMMFDCRRCPGFQACDDAEEINTVYNPKSFARTFFVWSVSTEWEREIEREEEREKSGFFIEEYSCYTILKSARQTSHVYLGGSEKDESLWRGWRQFVWSTKTNHGLDGY